MREFHILSLGAGVQSTALYLMGMDGDLDVEFDACIFADPGDEPQAVYTHLDWLDSLGGPPILVRSIGRLGDDIAATTGEKKRIASIPAFTLGVDGVVGTLRRQCTNDYKIQVVERAIRRDILQLPPRKHIPKDVKVIQYVGFSYDEPGRAARARGRFNQRGWTDVRFPLIEDRMTPTACIEYLEQRVPHTVPRSACVFCPYKSNREWKSLKDAGGADWERAVEIDKDLRPPGTVMHHKIDSPMFLHRTCKPIDEAYLDEDQMDLFDMECEGGCGL